MNYREEQNGEWAKVIVKEHQKSADHVSDQKKYLEILMRVTPEELRPYFGEWVNTYRTPIGSRQVRPTLPIFSVQQQQMQQPQVNIQQTPNTQNKIPAFPQELTQQRQNLMEQNLRQMQNWSS